MRKVYILSLLLSIAATACIGPFYEADYGKNIALPVGTPFEVRLEGDPHSEFAWVIQDLDTTVVRMVLSPAYTPHSDTAKTGGMYSFYFQTVGEGKTTLEMVYGSAATDQLMNGRIKTFSMDVESRI